jgi:hypothetical protein
MAATKAPDPKPSAQAEPDRTAAARVPRATIKHSQLAKVADEAMVATTTVWRWARGEHVSSITDQRIRRALTRLGLKALS